MDGEATDSAIAGSGWASIGISHVETAAEQGMRSRHLVFELGMALCETLGDDVIDEAITVEQRVPGLAASKTGGGVGLILRHGANEEIHLLFAQGIGRAGECVGRRRRGFDPAHNRGRSGISIPGMGGRRRRNIAPDLD